MQKQLSRFVCILSACILSALLFAGCNKESTEANVNAPANSNKPATAASSPATATSPATTASAEKIGVPECDDFLAKYESCVSGHVPEAARAQFKTSLEQWRSSWHKLAANPQTKTTLAAACKTAADQAKTSMKSYNCTF